MKTKPKSRATRGRHAEAPAPPDPNGTRTYTYPKETAPLRPDIGTQARFKKRKEPARYRYDSSVAPALEWDGQNAKARDDAEELIQEILGAETLEGAREAARRLQRMSRPFLNWAGKAERYSFDVPSMPLFVHERLSTSAILEALKGHRHDTTQMSMFDLCARIWRNPRIRARFHRADEG
jgi:adenine-specific DNA-methyltransferase